MSVRERQAPAPAPGSGRGSGGSGNSRQAHLSAMYDAERSLRRFERPRSVGQGDPRSLCHLRGLRAAVAPVGVDADADEDDGDEKQDHVESRPVGVVFPGISGLLCAHFCCGVYGDLCRRGL